MEHNDIYRILENLDSAQRSVKQLPALFKPPQTSPQLAGPYPGKNATQGYLVGEGEEDNVNPMTQAVTRRIVNQHPEWLMKYGPQAVMAAIDDVTEGDTEWEEIGSSDVSAYVNYVGDYLRDRGGDRSDMDEQGVSEGQDDTSHQVAQQILKQHRDARTADEDTIITAAGTTLQQMGMTPQQIRGIMNNPDFASDVIDHVRSMSENVTESAATTEDVISTVKKKLGDYLSDLSKEIKKDPDLKDRIPTDIDQIKAVKTIKTDDGHEIKIHGNEDDGFRISIKNKDLKTAFKNLDEATMACEMYCSRRRGQNVNADYIEEKIS
jgi:hypothetical protein